MRPKAKRLKRVISRMLVVMGHLRRQMVVPVLLYHSVDRSGSVISIAPEEFRVHMDHLKHTGHRAISLQNYVDYVVEGERASQKMVVITFDDGFKNNHRDALPILLQYGFTCTIFVATDFVGKTCTWGKDNSIPDLPMLSWDEIREMRDVGIEFGSHTCSHAHLPRLSLEEMKTELVRSKLIMEAEIERPVRFFCHPYGEVNEETQQVARKAGYVAAFGSSEYGSRNSKDDLYNLKRLGTGRFACLEDFKAGVLGTYDWFVHAKEYFGIGKSGHMGVKPSRKHRD